jgi:hypothetical protein
MAHVAIPSSVFHDVTPDPALAPHTHAQQNRTRQSPAPSAEIKGRTNLFLLFTCATEPLLTEPILAQGRRPACLRRSQLLNVGDGPERHDPGRVDLRMAGVIVLLDVDVVGGVLEGWVVPVEVLEPVVQVGVRVADGCERVNWLARAQPRPANPDFVLTAEVALEVPDIDSVEANDGREEPDVCLGELVPDDVLLAALEDLLEAVERLEQRLDRGLVRLLGGGEARLVDAVVDGVVDPLVLGLDLLLELAREEVNLGVLLGQDRVELAVEDADDLTAVRKREVPVS